ncbi:MAG: hypothetical protein WCG83_02830 [Candidatus Peregrinibacteria bacterium]
MSENASRHRHLVALPIVMVVTLISLFANYKLRQEASVVSIPSGIEVSGDGTEIIAQYGAEFDSQAIIPSLSNGSAVFQNDGVLRVKTSAGDVLGAAGAVHLSVQGSSLTIVALTTPVFFSAEQGSTALIPVGYQITVNATLPDIDRGSAQWFLQRKLLDIPPVFLREQILALNRFPHIHAFLPPVRFSVPSAVMTDALLPDAALRAQDRFRQEILGFLRGKIEAGDFSGARVILDDARFRFSFEDPLSSPSLLTLAQALPAGESGLRQALLVYLPHQAHLWLVGALHPKLREAVWSLPVPDLATQDRLALALALPFADNRPDSFPSIVYPQWRDGIASFASPFPGFLATFVKTELPLVSRYAAQQYPERAGTLLAMLRSLVAEDAVLSQIFQADFQAAEASLISSAAAPKAPPVHAAAVSSETSSKPVRTLSPEVLKAHAREMLTGAHALFTTLTTIVPSEGDSVHVSGIAFAGSDGDHEYTFDLDVVTGQVSGIVKDGTQMLYPLTFEKFGEWVRK